MTKSHRTLLPWTVQSKQGESFLGRLISQKPSGNLDFQNATFKLVLCKVAAQSSTINVFLPQNPLFSFYLLWKPYCALFYEAVQSCFINPLYFISESIKVFDKLLFTENYYVAILVFQYVPPASERMKCIRRDTPEQQKLCN